MTSLYGVIRGRPPKFFDGNESEFTGLQFHLDDEAFEFYQPVKMRDDPLWIDVTELMKNGNAGLGQFVANLSSDPDLTSKVGDYVGRLSNYGWLVPQVGCTAQAILWRRTKRSNL